MISRISVWYIVLVCRQDDCINQIYFQSDQSGVPEVVIFHRHRCAFSRKISRKKLEL